MSQTLNLHRPHGDTRALLHVERQCDVLVELVEAGIDANAGIAQPEVAPPQRIHRGDGAIRVVLGSNRDSGHTDQIGLVERGSFKPDRRHAGPSTLAHGNLDGHSRAIADARGVHSSVEVERLVVRGQDVANRGDWIGQ